MSVTTNTDTVPDKPPGRMRSPFPTALAHEPRSIYGTRLPERSQAALVTQTTPVAQPGTPVFIQPLHQQAERHHSLQRTLVVEDDPTLAALEAEILSAYGYPIIASTGEFAGATFRNTLLDLVVLDLELTSLSSASTPETRRVCVDGSTSVVVVR